MDDYMKIRTMTQQERATKFQNEANAFLSKMQVNLKAEIKLEKELPALEDEYVFEILKKLEEKYNVKYAPMVQINILYWPEEVKKAEEERRVPAEAEFEKAGEDEVVEAETKEV